MKTIQTLITFLLLTNLSYAQLAIANETPVAISTEMPSSTESQPMAYKASHSQSAMEQIRAYLVQQVTYPADMVKHGIEGRVQLAVSLSADGTIQHSEVVKGLHPELDAQILTQINELRAVNMIEGVYQGESTVYFSLRFRLNP